MSMFGRKLWPPTESHPYTRMALAIVVAPAIWGLVASAFGFVVGGMTEATREATLAFTYDMALAAFLFLFAFTLTLGLLGIGVLWVLSQRSAISWAMMGGGLGALVAAIHSYLDAGVFKPDLMILYVVLGWSLFLTIRWIAGVRETRPSET